ncbi:NIL domain-containing protein [Chloroflexota bacterium]
MALHRVILTFDPEIIIVPIIDNLTQQFNLTTNIYQRNAAEGHSWLELDIIGEDKDIEDGIAWVVSKGIRVRPFNE